VRVKNTLSDGLKKLGERFPQAQKAALTAGVLALADDVLNIAPTPPVDTGFLRGSASVFVGSRLVSGQGSVSAPEDVATFAMDTPYTAYQHELENAVYSNNSDKIGPKFVETKLVRFAKDYGKIMADRFIEVVFKK
jgi:hypothetical protein